MTCNEGTLSICVVPGICDPWMEFNNFFRSSTTDFDSVKIFAEQSNCRITGYSCLQDFADLFPQRMITVAETN